MSMRPIYRLRSGEVSRYLLSSRNYLMTDLPEYYNFSAIFRVVRRMVDASYDIAGAEKCDGVNYELAVSKDGHYDWRMLGLIHPVIYIKLAKLMLDSWPLIQQRLYELNKSNRRRGLACASLPNIDSKGFAEAGSSMWWRNVEQKILGSNIEYGYLCKTDIANCYDSIDLGYIPLALHGAGYDDEAIGSRLADIIKVSCGDRATGIPQGNAVCDLLAEIVLADIDRELSLAMAEAGVVNYKIIRYRDDYYIMTRRADDGRRIIELLAEVLMRRWMKLNEAKTCEPTDSMLAVVKRDKLNSLSTPTTIYTHDIRGSGNRRHNLPAQRRLLQLCQFSLENPNSGMLRRMLVNFNRELGDGTPDDNGSGDTPIECLTTQHDEWRPIISIALNILRNDPSTVKYAMNIIGVYLSKMKQVKRVEVVNNVAQYIMRLPCSELAQVWLRRVTYKYVPELGLSAPLANCVLNANTKLWNNDWLSGAMREYFDKAASIINEEELRTFEQVITFDDSDAKADY